MSQTWSRLPGSDSELAVFVLLLVRVICKYAGAEHPAWRMVGHAVSIQSTEGPALCKSSSTRQQRRTLYFRFSGDIRRLVALSYVENQPTNFSSCSTCLTYILHHGALGVGGGRVLHCAGILHFLSDPNFFSYVFTPDRRLWHWKWPR